MQDLGASIIDHIAKEADGAKLLKLFNRILEALMLERIFPSPSINYEMGVSQHHPLSAASILNLTLYMLSNKSFEPDSNMTTKIHNWIKRSWDARLFDYLLSIPGPTAEALAEHIFFLAIEEGDSCVAKKILDLGLSLNDVRCYDQEQTQRTPLQRSCELGNLELVRMLIDAGADVNSSPSGADFPLTLVIDHVSDEMLDLDDRVTSVSGDASALHGEYKLLRRMNVNLAQALLRASANVNPSSVESQLVYAVVNCHPELVSVLLSAGADANFSDSACSLIPLMHAVSAKGSISDIVSIVRNLLHAGANVHATYTSQSSTEVMTALQGAVTQASVDLLQILLKWGASISESALICAVEMMQLDIVEGFIGSGARVTPKVIKTAASTGAPEIFGHLFDSIESSLRQSNLYEALIAAIRYGKQDLFDMIMASNVKLPKGPELTAAIEAVVEKGDVPMLRILLDDRSTYRIDAIQSLGCSLCSSIAKGWSHITEMLLAAGADVNARSPETGRTPLLEALTRKDADLSRRLLAAGTAVNTQASYENRSYTTSELLEAVEWGHSSLIRDIINMGADLNAPLSRHEKLALTIAVERGDLVGTQLLISAGAYVNASATISSEYTPLVAAV